MVFNPLSAKFIKWSNTLKQIVGKLRTICLSVFDHFSGLALKGLRNKVVGNTNYWEMFQCFHLRWKNIKELESTYGIDCLVLRRS